jgi:hypothetical protein
MRICGVNEAVLLDTGYRRTVKFAVFLTRFVGRLDWAGMQLVPPAT